MALFAMGDTHLSLGTDKPMDKFPGWEDYVSRMEENWRKLVKPEDTVVIPGDISWGMTFDEVRPDLGSPERSSSARETTTTGGPR